ncbi:MAG: peptide chain release factor N(5)-glutamine methyltransferase [Woeseiaceae bacterium]|jgi:release factor glutamine methyltransferase
MSDAVSIEQAVLAATEKLRDVSDAPRLEAELLMARAINMPRSFLFAHPEDELDDASLQRLDDSVNRRVSGEPMAYITGIREFWSMELAVSPSTLVPRPETELLVDVALRNISRKAEWDILDLGTGSGAVALAIGRERALCSITATDISEDALAVARENANRNSIPNVEFLQGDWTGPVAGRTFHVIVSNPPYVRDDDEALEKLTAEPLSALAAGDKGLDAIAVIARDCPAILADDGLLVLEHGAEQEQLVAELLKQHGWANIRCYKDYSGLPRVTSANRKETS